MKKITLTIGILTLIVVGALLMIPTQEEPIKIGFKKHVAYLPLFVGVEKGMFEQEGLKVETQIFDSTNQMIGALVSGQIDASIGGANLQTVFSAEEKAPESMEIFTTLEVSETTGITCVMVGKDSELESLEQLKGTKAGTLPGTFSPMWTDETLKTVGLSVKDIELTGIAPKLQLAALESGSMDVLFTVEPVCSFGKNKGIAKIIEEEPLRHFGKSLTGSVMAKDLEEAEKLAAATDKAVDFIRSNPEESLAIMAKYTGYKPELIKGMKIPEFAKSTEINQENLEELAKKLGIGIKVEEMIYR